MQNGELESPDPVTIFIRVVAIYRWKGKHIYSHSPAGYRNWNPSLMLFVSDIEATEYS